MSRQLARERNIFRRWALALSVLLVCVGSIRAEGAYRAELEEVAERHGDWLRVPSERVYELAGAYARKPLTVLEDLRLATRPVPEPLRSVLREPALDYVYHLEQVAAARGSRDRWPALWFEWLVEHHVLLGLPEVTPRVAVLEDLRVARRGPPLFAPATWAASLARDGHLFPDRYSAPRRVWEAGGRRVALYLLQDAPRGEGAIPCQVLQDIGFGARAAALRHAAAQRSVDQGCPRAAQVCLELLSGPPAYVEDALLWLRRLDLRDHSAGLASGVRTVIRRIALAPTSRRSWFEPLLAVVRRNPGPAVDEALRSALRTAIPVSIRQQVRDHLAGREPPGGSW